MDPSTDADLSGLTGPEPGAVAAAAVRTSCWWLMALGTLALGARLRRNNKNARGGWQLWRLLLAVIVAMAVNATVYSAELAAFAATKDAYSGAVPSLHRAHIATSNTADASFIAVLMLLASGYCVTKDHIPPDRRAYVFGVPAVLFISGAITDYGFYELSSENSSEDDFSSYSRGDATFWVFSTLVNLGALLLAWVFIFDILEQEADALRAAELANNPRLREAADAAAAASHAHAAAPEYIDQSAMPEGAVAFKPLPATGGGGGGGGSGGGRGGGGGGVSSSSAAAHQQPADMDDEEAQLEAEFRDVMDRLRFEVKKKLLRRLSLGVAVYLVASTAALLLPVFVLGAVQVLVLMLKFVVEACFMGWLVWIFRPVEDSPYLLVGGTAEETEAMGADLETDVGGVVASQQQQQQQPEKRGGEAEEEDWGSAAAARVAEARLAQQQHQHQHQQQLPVSRAMGSAEARFSLGDDDAPVSPPPLAPPPPPPPPSLPPLAASGVGGVVASTSRGGSPVSTPTRRRMASGPGGGAATFADVKLD